VTQIPASLDAEWLRPQPAGNAVALAAPCYVDAAFHAFERDVVFARSWQLVAREDQVAAPGDHVVTAIGDVPLIVVRGEDGALRALHNVCRHRAGPLATCDGKGARALTCAYHGWTYGLDGALRGAPEMGAADDFAVTQIRLPEGRVAPWHGLVFAALGDAPPFSEVIAGVTTAAPLAFAQRVTYEIACDWKVYVDNYLEGYHLPRVHPELNALLDYRRYRTELAAWSVLQSSPLDRANSLYGSGAALYYWLYPNTMLNVLPGRLQTNRVLPLAAGRCRVDFEYFYAPGARDDHVDDIAFSDRVQHEDIAICEAVQRGLASGSYLAGRLNPVREQGVRHFHELLRAAYRCAPRA
jgi:choline monooxygenase